MDRDRWQEIEGLLREALARPLAEQESFVGERCADDTDLRREVCSLLEAHRRAGELGGLMDASGDSSPGNPFLDDPPPTDLPTSVQRSGVSSPEPRAFGPYEVERMLGEGGMSRVYLATRADDEYQRQVAVKVLKGHLQNDRMRERFRTERQILASLEHPNIAVMYEGGTTANGSPYLVMEHIVGLPIDEFCDRRRLSVGLRLRLFREVCSAVAYAHRNLVVHRDIKPSNILVTDDAQPKLLDFGIAKLLDADGSEPTITHTGKAFTPSYASPEQLREERMTTSTDVYSLGVLLYRLLTGRFPHDGSLEQRMQDLIDCREPILPSLVVRSDARGLGSADEVTLPSAAEMASLRGTEPLRLSRGLAGDLDAIVLKALRVSPEERYSAVEELSRELWRVQAGLPIMARRHTWTYRLGKFVSRHRLGVSLAMGAMLMTAGAALLMITMAARVAAERDQVQIQRDKARQISTYLVDMFEVQNARGGAERVDARELLAQAARRIAVEFEGNDDLQASLFDTLGTVYSQLGMLDKAGELLERGLEMRRGLQGPQTLDVAASLNNLSRVRYQQGRHEDSEALLEEALEIRLSRHGPDHPALVEDLLGLGKVRREKGALEAAEGNLRRGLAISRNAHGATHRTVADLSSELGLLLLQMGQPEEAEPLLKQAVDIHRQELGEQHPDLAESLTKLSILYFERGEFEQEEAHIRKALDIQRRVYQEPHPVIAAGLHHLGRSLFAQGRLDVSESFHRQGVGMNRLSYGGPHPTLATGLNDLALVTAQKGDLEQAIVLTREAHEMRLEVLPEDHPHVFQSRYNLASLLRDAGDLDASRALFEELMAKIDVLGESPAAAYPRGAYAELLIDLERYSEAESLAVEAFELLRESHPEGHWRHDWINSLIGICLVKRGRLEEAVPILETAIKGLQAKQPGDLQRLELPALALREARRVLGHSHATSS